MASSSSSPGDSSKWFFNHMFAFVRDEIDSRTKIPTWTWWKCKWCKNTQFKTKWVEDREKTVFDSNALKHFCKGFKDHHTKLEALKKRSQNQNEGRNNNTVDLVLEANSHGSTSSILPPASTSHSSTALQLSTGTPSLPRLPPSTTNALQEKESRDDDCDIDSWLNDNTHWNDQTSCPLVVDYSIHHQDEFGTLHNLSSTSTSSRNSIQTEVDDTRVYCYQKEHEQVVQVFKHLLSPNCQTQSMEAKQIIRAIANRYLTKRTNTGHTPVQVIPRNDVDVAVRFINAYSMISGIWIDTDQTKQDQLSSRFLMEDRLRFIRDHYTRADIVGYMISLVIIHWNWYMAYFIEQRTVCGGSVYQCLQSTRQTQRLLLELSLPRLYQLAIQANVSNLLVDCLLDMMCNMYLYLIDLNDNEGKKLHMRTTGLLHLCYDSVIQRREDDNDVNYHVSHVRLEESKQYGRVYSLLLETVTQLLQDSDPRTEDTRRKRQYRQGGDQVSSEESIAKHQRVL